MIEQSKPGKTTALRDRNLAKTAPLAFCLYVFLQELSWQGSNTELVKLVGAHPEQLTIVKIRNKLLQLGYNTSQLKLRSLKRINSHQLPGIFVDNENTSYVIYVDKVSKRIMAKNYDGIFELTEIIQCGDLIKINQELIKLSSSLKDIIIAKLTKVIANAYIKSFMLAITGLLVPIYIRIIFNIIIPSQNIFSCFWVLICAILVLWYENKLRNSRDKLIGRLLTKIENNLESRLLLQLTRSRTRGEADYSTEKINRITNNINIFIDYLRTSLIYAILDSPFITVYLIAIALIGGNIVWTPIIIMGVTAIITFILSQYYDSASATEYKKNTDTFSEQYKLIKIDKQIRLLGLTRQYINRLKKIYISQSIASLKTSKYLNYLQIYLSLSGRLAIIISLLVLFNINSGANNFASQGQILSIMFLFYRVFGPYQLLLNALLKYKSNIKIYRTINEILFLNLHERPSSEYISKKEQYTEKYLLGHLQLDGVTTTFKGSSSGSLKGIDLKIKPGELIVISSKQRLTSQLMLNILTCVDQSYGGVFLIDGTNSKQFSEEFLSSNIACAFERQHFFDNTIMYNLKVFNDNLEDKDVYDICKFTGIHEYICQLNDGYETVLTQYKTSQLNKGFRKMLVITQALIKDTPIMILEEPTNGLSPSEFDQLIGIMGSFRHRLDKTQMRTTVVFSSSDKLMDKADRVCVIDNGRILFNGNKRNLQELIKKKEK